MIISDLNYLETAEQTVVGGYYFGENVNTTIKEKLDIRKYLESKVYVKGNFAGSEANADAVGYNTSTQAISSTAVIQGVGSSSKATSVSATSGYHW